MNRYIDPTTIQELSTKLCTISRSITSGRILLIYDEKLSVEVIAELTGSDHYCHYDGRTYISCEVNSAVLAKFNYQSHIPTVKLVKNIAQWKAIVTCIDNQRRLNYLRRLSIITLIIAVVVISALFCNCL